MRKGLFTVVFMVSITIAFISVLAFVNEISRERIAKNQEIRRIRSIMYACNIFPGQITNIHHLDKMILLEINCGINFNVEILPATVTRLNIEIGNSVYLVVKASSFKRLK